jgi:hypothetical protein
MKALFVAMGLVAVSTSAFAQPGGPIVQGNKCWAITDGRGFGYWDSCATGPLLEQRNRDIGVNPRTPRALTQLDNNDYGGAGGAGGGAGGGGGGQGR